MTSPDCIKCQQDSKLSKLFDSASRKVAPFPQGSVSSDTAWTMSDSTSNDSDDFDAAVSKVHKPTRRSGSKQRKKAAQRQSSGGTQSPASPGANVHIALGTSTAGLCLSFVCSLCIISIQTCSKLARAIATCDCVDVCLKISATVLHARVCACALCTAVHKQLRVTPCMMPPALYQHTATMEDSTSTKSIIASIDCHQFVTFQVLSMQLTFWLSRV